jgi:hypothetical protein
MWKSPVPKGKRAGKANVKKYWVVNSEMGIFCLVGHGIVTVPFLLTVTPPWSSPITALTTFSTVFLISTLGSAH